MASGYVCSVCRTPIADVAAISCSNCGVNFNKVAPTVANAPPWPPILPFGVAGRNATGWRLPPEFDPSWAIRPWWRRHWRIWIMLLVLTGIVAVYGFLFLILGMMVAVPTQRIDAELSERSGGRILNTLYIPGLVSLGGRGRFMLMVAPDVTASDAQTLACTVVRPTLAREGYSSAAFELGRGQITLATDSTPCP
jgi:hypothetical protein